MQVYIFRGPGRVFGVTEDAAGANLPAKFAPWAPFRSQEVVRGQATLGLDSTECLDDIAQYGFHITNAHVRITDEVV
ncbi:hypothetical protein [Dyella acidiphila]|uniref:Uncharacterized protein n=1 Tax=Dyella acidiphila TaxID=2775866 RepID=A0ABR9GAQ5_9GAMM|nr:hypothetical protein [Dyella acidiphila]MBE1161120.1 hypothetical protein [Dyella acidiphila]